MDLRPVWVDANPLATDSGLEKLRALSEQHKVKILSICADYFMDKPLVRASQGELEDRLKTFHWLLERGRLIGINRMVIPFVDASRIDTQAEFDGVVMLLQRILDETSKTGIEIHLETSLAPTRFAELLSRLPDARLKVNYDSGNSSSLGYALGKNLPPTGSGWAASISKTVYWEPARSRLGRGTRISLPWPKGCGKCTIKEISFCR